VNRQKNNAKPISEGRSSWGSALRVVLRRCEMDSAFIRRLREIDVRSRGTGNSPCPRRSGIGDAGEALRQLPQLLGVRALAGGLGGPGEAQRPTLFVLSGRPVIGTADSLRRCGRVQGGNRSLGSGMVVVQVLRPLFSEGAVQPGTTLDQLGDGDARMRGNAANSPACVIAAPLQLECPVQHGQLGLGVGAVGVV